MKTFTYFVYAAETTLGSIALGAIWLSPLPTAVMVSFTSALVLLCFLHDVHGLQALHAATRQAELLMISVQALERRIAGDSTASVLDSLQADHKRHEFGRKLAGDGIAYVITAIGKYAIWAVGAWAVYGFGPEIVTRLAA
jgi:hypothetical protein